MMVVIGMIMNWFLLGGLPIRRMKALLGEVRDPFFLEAPRPCVSSSSFRDLARR